MRLVVACAAVRPVPVTRPASSATHVHASNSSAIRLAAASQRLCPERISQNILTFAAASITRDLPHPLPPLHCVWGGDTFNIRADASLGQGQKISRAG